jgi:hypothetical protein
MRGRRAERAAEDLAAAALQLDPEELSRPDPTPPRSYPDGDGGRSPPSRRSDRFVDDQDRSRRRQPVSL